MNIEFLEKVPVDDSVEVDGVVIDYAKGKRIVAIEVLDASKRTTREPLDLINLALVRSSASDVMAKSRGPIAARQGAELNLPGDEVLAKGSTEPSTLNMERGTLNFEPLNLHQEPAQTSWPTKRRLTEKSRKCATRKWHRSVV